MYTFSFMIEGKHLKFKYIYNIDIIFMLFSIVTGYIITIECHLGPIITLLAIFLTNLNDIEEGEQLQTFKLHQFAGYLSLSVD